MIISFMYLDYNLYNKQQQFKMWHKLSAILEIVKTSIATKITNSVKLRKLIKLQLQQKLQQKIAIEMTVCFK